MNSFQRIMTLALSLLALGWVSAAPGEIQPSSQTSFGPDKQQVDGLPVALSAKTATDKLPNINIFIDRNEIKKLLGIDSRIYYVTNGNIDTYPFGFRIPLGYNQTDMLFTWQNLGQTNVNYSISLVIGNILAVEAPLINITRSGLIPTHEQVFRITLPCSGKMSVEVDFQVLINITGYVADQDQEPAPKPSSSGSQAGLKAAESLDFLAAGPELAQSDQAQEAPKMRLVSHTLTLNRKKICTVHPVPMPVQPVSQRPVSTTSAPSTSAPDHLWVGAKNQAQAAQPAQPQHNQAPSSPLPTSRTLPDGRASQTTSVDPPPELSGEPAARNPFPSLDLNPLGDFLDEGKSLATSAVLIPPASRRNHQEAGPSGLGAYAAWPRPGKFPAGKLAPAPALSGNEIDPTGRALYQQQQVAPSNSPLLFTLVALSLLISVALIWLAILGSSSSSLVKRSPLDKLFSFTGNILRRTPASQMVANKCVKSACPVINSFRAGPKSQASSMSGLSAISGGPFSVSNQKSGSSLSPGHCYKPSCAANGYYTASGASQQQHHHHQQGYHYSPGSHLYQQPPTADLLGTGYQCQQQVPVVPPPQYPIHHIATGNLNHTTRLIWNNGNGTSPDGFTIENTYMPLSNAPRSEGGSAYQTIY